MEEFLTSTDFWAILIKSLVTGLLTAAVGLICTLIGKALASWKHSKIRTHAKIAVKAAEQKFPNEGKKMGPEKMAYVMDYLAITFPKIKSNKYLYNIAEAAVYELNNKEVKQEAEQEFKDKYGELPDELIESNTALESTTTDIIDTNENISINEDLAKDQTVFTLKSF